MAKKIRVWDGTQWQDVAPALPYTAVHSAQASMPSTGIDGQIWLDTDGTLSDTAFVPLSTIDAKGDLLVGTADNTVNKLTAGSNDTVLTADSSTATGLKWATPSAGGMTLLASGSIAASATGVDITSISASYNELWLYLTNYSTTALNQMQLRINNNTSADYSALYVKSQSTSVSDTTGATALTLTDGITAATVGLSAIIRFPNYANTTGFKLIDAVANYTNEYSWKTFGLIKATAAISRITILLNGGAFDAGTYTLYGVK